MLPCPLVWFDEDGRGEKILQPQPRSDQSHSATTVLQREADTSPISPSRDWRLCLGLGFLALVLNLYRLGEPGIWFDEALSIERASQPFPVVWQLVFATQPNMALYYFLLAGWLKLVELAGLLPIEFIVRFPSALCATLTTVVLYQLGRRFCGRTAGLVGAGLYLLNALQLTYAHEARSYSLQLLFICLAWYALFKSVGDAIPRVRFWLIYSVLMTLAVYAHLISLLVLFSQVVAFICLLFLPTLWQKQARQRWPEFMGSLVAIGVAVAPLLLAAQGNDRTDWLPAATPDHVLRFLVSLAGGNKVYVVLFAVLWLTCFAGLFVLFRMQHRFNRNAEEMTTTLFLDCKRASLVLPVMLALFCWCLVTASSGYLVSQGATRLFSTRYMVIIVPALLLLIGAGIQLLAWTRLRRLLMTVIFLVASFSVPAYYQGAQVEDWREATFWLQSEYQSGDGMVCYDNFQGCQLDVAYYLRAYPRGMSFPSDSPGSFPWVVYDLTDQVPVDPSLALDPQVLKSYASKHIRMFFITGRYSGDEALQQVQATHRWLDVHYRRVAQFNSRTVTIHLYDVQFTR